MIEKHSPQIIGDDAEIWIKFIRRDVAKYADELPPYPRHPRNWYKVYKELVKQNQREMDAQADELKATMEDLRNTKIKSQIIERDKSQLPRVPKLPNQRSDAPRPKRKEAQPINAGSKTKNIFAKLRKEKREAAKMKPLFRPKHTLGSSAGTIIQAPQSMVDDYRRPQPPKEVQYSSTNPRLSVSARQSQYRTMTEESRPHSGLTAEAREKRLLALTNPNMAARSLSSTAQSTSNGTPEQANDLPPSSSRARQNKSSRPISAASDSTSISARINPTLEKHLSTSSPTSPVTVTTSSHLAPPLARRGKSPLPRRISPEPGSTSLSMKKKAATDIFLPAKRRKVA